MRPLGLHFTKSKPVSGAGDYFQAFLRQYMMAKKPERENYQSWQNRQFVLDSIAWEQDPLYGWCNKNTKRNGEPYNVILMVYVSTRLLIHVCSSMLKSLFASM